MCSVCSYTWQTPSSPPPPSPAALCLSCQLPSGASTLVSHSAERTTPLSVIHTPRSALTNHLPTKTNSVPHPPLLTLRSAAPDRLYSTDQFFANPRNAAASVLIRAGTHANRHTHIQHFPLSTWRPCWRCLVVISCQSQKMMLCVSCSNKQGKQNHILMSIAFVILSPHK